MWLMDYRTVAYEEMVFHLDTFEREKTLSEIPVRSWAEVSGGEIGGNKTGSFRIT